MIKRHLRSIPLALALLGASSVHAAGPQLDIHKAMNAAPTANATRRIETSVGTVASMDELRGVPTFLWVAPPDAANVSSRPMPQMPEDIARDFVKKNIDLYNLSSAAIDTMFVREVHDTGTGGIIVIFAQKVDGIEVWHNEMKVLLNRQGDVIAVGGNLHGDAISTAQGGTKRVFSIADDQAIAQAFADRTGIRIQKTNLLATGREENGYRFFELGETFETKKQGIVFATDARAKKILYAMPDRLVPAYYLELDMGKVGSTGGDLWGYVVSAETGELLDRDHLTQDAAYSYRVYSDTTAPYTPLDGPIADWTPHPTGLPNGSSPPFISPVAITLDGLNTNPGGTFDPWLAMGATTTTGNNVDAYADIVAADGFNNGDRRPTAMGTNFNFTYDTSAAPNTSAQRDASVTSLFFLNNWLHDYFYDSGFNEAAGNAQANNFGRGGAQNDRLLAEAQDYSGTDNANMSTPADGTSPRMQMYVFTGAIKGNLTVLSPMTTLGNQAAGFGPNPFTTTADLVVATDGMGTDVNDICEPVTNNVMGKIALINRGTCTFESKVLRAQQAGAAGVLIINNVPDTLPGMADDPNTNGVTIGSLGIYQTDGNWLKTLMQSQTVTVTMSSNPKKVDRDGTIDNHIASHEWGHYMHKRLVTTCTTYNCGTVASPWGCGQCGSESEGWGDFVALHMALRNGDNLTSGTYAASIYASDAFGDSAYFGIRRFAYSRDFTKNALTFKHIMDGQALPVGTPQNSAFPNNNEVHNAGEVWASMMFQAYTQLQLFGGHTFAESKRRMANYVVAGMKLSPNNPTFIQQRNGILAAARAADLNDAVLLADGFAARGIGTCAVGPAATSTTHAGVVENFDNVGVMQITGATVTENVGCDGDGVVDTDETGNVNVTVFNSGIGYLLNTQVSVTSGTAGVTFPSGNMGSIASIAPGATGTASIPVAMAMGTTAITDADFAITTTNPKACVNTANGTATAQMNYDNVAASSATEEFESPLSPWVKWGAVGYETLATTLWSRRRQVVGDYWFNGANHTNVSDTALESPSMAVGPGNLTIAFTHRFDLDYTTGPVRYYDGGVVEISNNNGTTWTDVATLGAAPGYTGTLQTGTGNPLAGKQAYSRQNPAWPNTNTVTLNLGTQFAGQNIKIRFRLGTDNQVRTANTQGWFIDTIAATGLTNTPFHTIVQDPLGCSACAGVTCNDNNPCTTDACNAMNGACVFTPVANGSACSDGNACTTGETCNAGACGGGTAVTCNDNNSCTTDSCDMATGCAFAPVVNGTACSDGDACTQTDTCQAGACTGANPVTCTASDQCHDVGTCNSATGMCSNPNKADGSTCSDGSACTTGEVCTAGACGGGTAVTCNDNNSCTTDSCDVMTGCAFAPVANGTGCSDGNACTQSDTCQAGACTGANPVTCTALDQCHDVGTCNTTTGVCDNPNKANGTTCNDGSACTTGEACNAGACTGGTAVTCNDNNACTTDSCNPMTGCAFAPVANGSSCSDGDACTTGETCNAGACGGGTAVTCNDNNACTTDSCNPTSGCAFAPAMNGTACDDGNGCTQTDTCQAGACAGANPVTCMALDQCHVVGTCNSATGACDNPPIADGTNCDDSNLCTTMDSCKGGNCNGTPITCGPPGECQNPGTCNPMLGICEYPAKPNGTPCTNGTCQTGTCMMGTGGAGGMGGTGGTGGMAGTGGMGGTGGIGGTAGTGGIGGMGGTGGIGGTAGTGGIGGTAGTGGTAGMGGTGGTAGMGGTGGTAGMGSTTSSTSSGVGGKGGEGGQAGAGGAGGKIVVGGGGCDCASTTSNTTSSGSALLLGLGALIAGLRRRRNAA